MEGFFKSRLFSAVVAGLVSLYGGSIAGTNQTESKMTDSCSTAITTVVRAYSETHKLEIEKLEWQLEKCREEGC